MNLVFDGDVVILHAGITVQIGHGTTTVLAEPKKCVVVATRKPKAGTEDDHFEECYLVDLQPLTKEGAYDPGARVLTVAQYGDFKDKYIVGELEVLGKMQRTFVQAGQ